MNLSKILAPQPLPFTYAEWKSKPFAERVRMLCVAWATQGYGAPVSAYVFYVLKIGFYLAGWLFFCSFSSALGGVGEIANWWFQPEALEKFVLWSILFEVLGLGCGSGPLTARYFPPMGGVLHFARPGTIKLPLFQKLPIIGGDKRSVLDVLLYVALLGSLLRVLLASVATPELILPVVVLIPILGILDKTIYLAARSEHYLIALICFLFVGEEIAAAKIVWLAIWWGAATSKVNRHFPAVVCVMISNHAVLRFPWLRRKLYKNYPNDLRPSRLAASMAHIGTLTEYGFPLLLIFGGGGPLTTAGLVIMFGFHLYITSSFPMGVPLEWNVIMVYGAFLLFGHHAEVWMFSLQAPLLIAILTSSLLLVPILGNLFPKWVSFLLSMRYYAGNWAYSVWLFKGDCEEKLDEGLMCSSSTVHRQLCRFYDGETAETLVSKVIAFRSMHLHGRALQLLVPEAVDDIESYTWRDGELIAGVALGWNFGDGHLHNERLLQAIQKRCDFAPGQLRCIFVESQPAVNRYMAWRIVDAHDGELKRGKVSVKELEALQPFPVAATQA
ncbi:MAG: DUF3556 domain-containing protein [Bacteroidota bacterium]